DFVGWLQHERLLGQALLDWRGYAGLDPVGPHRRLGGLLRHLCPVENKLGEGATCSCPWRGCGGGHGVGGGRGGGAGALGVARGGGRGRGGLGLRGRGWGGFRCRGGRGRGARRRRGRATRDREGGRATNPDESNEVASAKHAWLLPVRS